MKIAALLLTSLLTSVGSLSGEDRKPDPSDIWYRGFLRTQAAEESIKAGSPVEAINALNEAFGYYKRLALEFPDFHSAAVHHRMQQLVSNRHQLMRTLSHGESPEIETLKQELEELKRRLRQLRDRRQELDRELESLRKRDSGSEVGFSFDGLDPLGQTFERPGFHQATDIEEEKLFSRPKGLHALPHGGWDLYDFQGPGIGEANEPPSPGKIPENWIPRPYAGEMTYLIPLVETSETVPFSQLIPIPAILEQVCLPK